MSYQSRDLSVLAYANGFTLWHYTTADSPATVAGGGYFNAAADMLRAGDIVIANVDTGTTPKAGLFFIAQAGGGTVDAADMTQIGATNAG